MYRSKWKYQTIKFLTAQTISLFGSSLVQFAIVWHITLQTSSGSMLTIAVLCGYLPQMFISLFAGAWLDKYNRKNIMIMADATIAFFTLIVAICFLAGVKDLWILFTVLAARSAATGIQLPAVNAFIPMLVPEKHLLKVNGINSTLTSVTYFLSPAASAGVLAAIGMEATFFIDVITAIVGIGLMLTIRYSHNPDNVAKESSWQAIINGFAYLKKANYIRSQIIYAAIVSFLVSPTAFLSPLLITRHFGGELWRLSVTEMAFSAGAALGGLIIAYFTFTKKLRKTIVIATGGYALFTIGIGAGPTFATFLICNTFLGIIMPCYNAPLTAAIQQRAAPEQLGRVFSILQIATAGALPAGTLIFGPLADIIPIRTLLIGTGLIMLVFTIFAWRNKKFINA